MKGEKALKDHPFRYGGLFHNYDRDCEDWASIDKHMQKCYACGKEMKNVYSKNGTLLKQNFPYVGVYTFTKGDLKGYSRFRPICRACAYAYGRGVIEMDGETYSSPEAFSELVYKKGRKDNADNDTV